MSRLCKVCNGTVPDTSHHGASEGICDSCREALTSPSRNSLLDAIDAPVLLMQGNPRQVVTANEKAAALFRKETSDIEGHRGGEVFDCVHSFTTAGCGKDVNCEQCVIKNAIVETFVTAEPRKVSTTLQVKKSGAMEQRTIQVSTEKVGELALVRIEKYETTH